MQGLFILYAYIFKADFEKQSQLQVYVVNVVLSSNLLLKTLNFTDYCYSGPRKSDSID